MLSKLLMETRSCRRFKPVTQEIVESAIIKAIDDSRLGHAARSIQGLNYILVSKLEMVAQISQANKWAKNLAHWEGPTLEEQPSAFVIMLQDMTQDLDSAPLWCNAGIAAQIITMSLTENRLASCIMAGFNHQILQEILHLTDEYTPLLCIAIGRQGEEIVVDEQDSNETIGYYRDQQDRHHVIKPDVSELIVDNITG